MMPEMGVIYGSNTTRNVKEGIYIHAITYLDEKKEIMGRICSHWMKNRICPKFAWCKYVANMKFAKLCNQCKGGNGRICAKTGKFGHRHTCTVCKAVQSSYLQHICTRQI